ncbi:MAG: PhoPQ-activated protein PqaA family protein, partial [Bacteroidota bacterium]
MHKLLLLIILALQLLSCEAPKEIPVTAETALEQYLDNGDAQYQWERKESYAVEGQPVTAYDLVLISQQWREHVWKHQLTVLVPAELTEPEGLLFITGGSLKNGEPKFKGP